MRSLYFLKNTSWPREINFSAMILRVLLSKTSSADGVILAEFYFNNRYMRIFSFMPFNRGFAIFASFLSYFCFDLEYKKFGFKKINGDYINMARVKTVVMFCPDIGVKKGFVDKLRKGRCDDSFGA